VPHAEDVPALYARYYTHGEDGGAGDVLGQGTPRAARLAYLRARYGYAFDPAPPAALALALALVPGRREHLDLSVLGLRAEWRGPLLDVGCGQGVMLRLMRDLGWQAEGIDLDERAVQVAQAAGLAARAGTFESLALPEAHYAAVTSSHVLEHVADPLGFLRSCRRLTRPGGRLALTTPNAGSLGARVFGARWRGLEPPRHFQVLTVRSLTRLAREAGYTDVRVATSARLAAMIVRETLRPAIVGRSTSHEAGVPLRVLASMFQVIERSLLAFSPALGEELFLTARAPGGAA
jgi:2-polyprenyl-3-methyl-5-hydroxy-6-metoxy-1,4-benzoquinol methylase